jgi:hypothetical protein
MNMLTTSTINRYRIFTIIAITAISINIAMVVISMLPLYHITMVKGQGVDCIALSKTINQDTSNTTDTAEKRVNDMATYIANCG